MEHGDGDEPPSDDQHGVSYVRRTALDDQEDDQQTTAKSGDDQQSREVSGFEGARKFDGHSLPSITHFCPFQLEGKAPLCDYRIRPYTVRVTDQDSVAQTGCCSCRSQQHRNRAICGLGCRLIWGIRLIRCEGSLWRSLHWPSA